MYSAVKQDGKCSCLNARGTLNSTGPRYGPHISKLHFSKGPLFTMTSTKSIHKPGEGRDGCAEVDCRMVGWTEECRERQRLAWKKGLMTENSTSIEIHSLYPRGLQHATAGSGTEQGLLNYKGEIPNILADSRRCNNSSNSHKQNSLKL